MRVRVGSASALECAAERATNWRPFRGKRPVTDGHGFEGASRSNGIGGTRVPTTVRLGVVSGSNVRGGRHGHGARSLSVATTGDARMPPLARDQHGISFDVPPDAAFWRVRRHTGGRPSTVLGPDGEPLFIPIAGDRADLREGGCNGSLRLEAVDAEHKSVNAPVAFVELVASDDVAAKNTAPSEGLTDLVRMSFDSVTRTMEAMQRAQVERERALADKERKVTDAQVEMQRTHVQLMIALLERAGGGKPQDPMTVVRQQLAIKKALDEQSSLSEHRNADLLLASEATSEGGDNGLPNWLNVVLTAAPAAVDVYSRLTGGNSNAGAAVSGMVDAIRAAQPGAASAGQAAIASEPAIGRAAAEGSAALENANAVNEQPSQCKAVGGAPVVVEIEVAAQLTPRGFSGSLNEKEPP